MKAGLKKHVIYLRQHGNCWQFSRVHPDDPDCHWWGDYKTEGAARSQARSAITRPLGVNGKHVPAEIAFVTWSRKA